MTDTFSPTIRPDFYGQLAATDPYQRRARRLFERGRVAAVNSNEAEVLVGYDAHNNPLELKQVPIVSGYLPQVGDWVALQYEAGHSGAPWVTGPSMAADSVSDPAGIRAFSVSSSAPAAPQQSVMYFDATQQTWRGWDGEQWVDFAGHFHNNLPDLQGGGAEERYHLTASQWTGLTAGAAGRVAYYSAAGVLASTAGFTYDAANDRLYVAGQLGVGAAPLANYAIWAELTGTSDTQWTGLLGIARVSGIGANFTSLVYGGFSGAYYSDAGRSATRAAYGLIGHQYRLVIDADNTVVEGAVGAWIRGMTTAGTSRAFTAVDLVRADTSIAAGGSIGTLRAFYMPACTGTTRWGVYIADTGAPSYFAAQVQFASGDANAPGVAFLAETGLGCYRKSAGVIGCTGHFDLGSGKTLRSNGTQVVGAQQSAIASIGETGVAQDGAARGKINDILSALRAHGLIAT